MSDHQQGVIVGATWGKQDGAYSYNLAKGFGGAMVPALYDGSATADGGEITNPGGYIHNGAECSIIQTDADFAIFGGASFWGDGLSWTAVSYADFLARQSFLEGLVIQFEKVNSVCCVKEFTQRDVGYQWTAANYTKDENWRTSLSDDCGASALIPYPIDSGDGIGPNNGWYPIDDEYVYLVEDA